MVEIDLALVDSGVVHHTCKLGARLLLPGGVV